MNTLAVCLCPASVFINLKKTMNTLAGQRQTVQQNFCNCAQTLKTNPQFLYEELKNISLNQIPPGFKNPNFRGDTEGGYLCEIRIKDIFFSIGCAMSKAGARDRAIEQ